jgi:hypothetical protein
MIIILVFTSKRYYNVLPVRRARSYKVCLGFSKRLIRNNNVRVSAVTQSCGVSTVVYVSEVSRALVAPLFSWKQIKTVQIDSRHYRVKELCYLSYLLFHVN